MIRHRKDKLECHPLLSPGGGCSADKGVACLVEAIERHFAAFDARMSTRISGQKGIDRNQRAHLAEENSLMLLRPATFVGSTTPRRKLRSATPFFTLAPPSATINLSLQVPVSDSETAER